MTACLHLVEMIVHNQFFFTDFIQFSEKSDKQLHWYDCYAWVVLYNSNEFPYSWLTLWCTLYIFLGWHVNYKCQGSGPQWVIMHQLILITLGIFFTE